MYRHNSGKPQQNKIYSDIYEKRLDVRDVSILADLERAHMEENALVFDSPRAQRKAFEAGVFLLKIPDGLQVHAGDDFADQFYRGRCSSYLYGRYREITAEQFSDALLGFHQRTNQIEQFLLERRFWSRYYPAPIAALGEQMTELSRQLLGCVLKHTDIPASEWRKATGSCSHGEGAYHLTFNHYRAAMKDVGLNSHKDDGFLTILRTTKPGLEVNRKDRWEKVPVDAGYFVINFGLSMELLTSKCASPVAAIMHRVAHQSVDRTSFGHFSSSTCIEGRDEGVYRYIPRYGLEPVCGSRELIDMNDREIYQGTHTPEVTRHE